MHGHQNIKT